MMDQNKIRKKFSEIFQQEPLLVRSPGRVNLIGEHTDYNLGFVLPAAIDKDVICAVAKNTENVFSIHAYDLKEDFQTQTNELKSSGKGWPDYLLGIVDQLKKAGHTIEGFNCVLGGDIPLGAGLSSSAAIECAMIFALNELFQLNIDEFEMVKMAQKAENEFVGVQCGIMDQFASMFGKYNEVIKLDCRSLEASYFHFDMSDYLIVLCDTNVKHSLASSEYNTRRKECEEGVKLLKEKGYQVNSLRDVTLDLLEKHEQDFDAIIYKRCRYIVEENQRVHAACDDLRYGRLKAFGEKMYLSHAGLRDNYEVSCKELDFLVSQTKNDDQVLGARMMGGGFGGCTINIIDKSYLEQFVDKMKKAYQQDLNLELDVYVASIAKGTHVVG